MILCPVLGASPPAMQDEEEQTQDHVPRQASNPAAKPSRMATLRQVSIQSRCIVRWQSCTLHVQSALGDAKPSVVSEEVL